MPSAYEYGTGTYGVDVYGGVGITNPSPLWPSTTLFPDPALYPDQGRFPFVRCLISTDDFQGTSRTWTDYSDRLRAWQVTRGRPNELQAFDAGTCSVTLTNRDRALDPTLNSQVGPMNKVWLYSEYAGATEDLAVMFTERVELTWPDGGWSDALATFQCSDEFKALARRDQTDVNAPIEQAGPRIGRLLDLASSQAPRSLGNGSTYMATRTGTFGLKAEIELAVDTESPGRLLGGAFFFGRHGDAVFYEFSHRSMQTLRASFSDDAFSVTLPYLDLQVDYSDSFLANTATVDDTSGISGSYQDVVSDGRYGERIAPAVTVSMSGVSVSNLQAGAFNIVSFYKNPLLRATLMVPDLSNPDTLTAMLRTEVLDKLQVTRHPPGGGSWTQTVYVQSIAWSGVPGELPALQLGLSPR